MSVHKNSKARIEANNRYNAKAYDRINIAVPRGMKAVIEDHAKQNGSSINGFICGLIIRELGITVDAWKHGNGNTSEDKS